MFHTIHLIAPPGTKVMACLGGAGRLTVCAFTPGVAAPDNLTAAWVSVEAVRDMLVTIDDRGMGITPIEAILGGESEVK